MAKKGKAGEGAVLDDDWKTDADVIKILEELEAAVHEGLKDPDHPKDSKVLHPDATNALNEMFGPKIFRRHHMPKRPSWENSKGQPKKDGKGPLSAAFRLGLIASILSTTKIVTVEIATTAGEAVQKDEHCRASGGAGDWCG